MQQVHKVHRSQAATRPVLVRCSKKGVRINCLYKPHEQHHAPLERPKALALGLERAAAASAAVDSIGHIGSLQRVGAPQRLRVAVDVDEGETHEQLHWRRSGGCREGGLTAEPP